MDNALIDQPAPPSTHTQSASELSKLLTAAKCQGRWIVIVCVLLGLSGAVRYWRSLQFLALENQSKESPFPLKDVPLVLGSWRSLEGAESTLDPEIAKVAGSSDHVIRTYVDDKSGERITVLLLYGPAQAVWGHTPEVCYPASGFKTMAASREVQIPVEDGSRTAAFTKALYGKTRGARPRSTRSSTRSSTRAPGDPIWPDNGRSSATIRGCSRSRPNDPSKPPSPARARRRIWSPGWSRRSRSERCPSRPPPHRRPSRRPPQRPRTRSEEDARRPAARRSDDRRKASFAAWALGFEPGARTPTVDRTNRRRHGNGNRRRSRLDDAFLLPFLETKRSSAPTDRLGRHGDQADNDDPHPSNQEDQDEDRKQIERQTELNESRPPVSRSRRRRDLSRLRSRGLGCSSVRSSRRRRRKRSYHGRRPFLS